MEFKFYGPCPSCGVRIDQSRDIYDKLILRNNEGKPVNWCHKCGVNMVWNNHIKGWTKKLHRWTN